MRFIKFLFFVSFFSLSSQAMNLDWEGGYRFEWTQIDRPSLDSIYESKAYGLNYLYLAPRIIASDGFNIVSRFDVLNSQDPAYANSQVGSIWGAGLPPAVTTDGSRRNTTTQTQNASPVQVSQLYLHVVQEYGSLLVGRAPMEFGLGMVYNAGNGMFDHWYNTRDLMAYKFIIGNFHFTPMISRVYDENYWLGNSIQDETIEVGYEAPESRSTIGVLLEKRKASNGVNDIDATRVLRPAYHSGSVLSDYSTQRTNFLLGKAWDGFGFKIEASFLTGDTGIQTTRDEWVKINGYGVATEWYFPNPESKWNWTVRAGMATGDDPTTADYEGFQFDKNYDVAFLLFNHRIGRRDFLTTDMVKDLSAGRGLHNSVDDEAIGNTWYLSPKLKYAWNDKVELNNSLTYAQVWTNPTGVDDFDRDLGVEWDLEVVYKPRQKIHWVNQLGVLFPGHAFQNGKDSLGNSTNIGLASKIAISF